jgi:hypothetical protein
LRKAQHCGTLNTFTNHLCLPYYTVISVVALTVSVAALVGSIYGMNVIIGVEDDPVAFRRIVIGTSVSCLLFLLILLYIFYRALVRPDVNLA